MAFISEMDYVGGGEDFPSSEFVEITLRPGENPADFTLSFYDSDGSLTTSNVSSFFTDPAFANPPEITLQEILDAIQGAPPGTGVLQEGSLQSPQFPTISGRELEVIEHPDDPGGFIFIIPSDLGDSVGGDTADSADAVALTNTSTGEVVSAFDMGPNVTVPTFTEGAAAGTTPTQTIASHPDGSVQVDAAGNVTTTNSPNAGGSVICFTEDTLLMTPRGPRRAADLAIGDLVCTQDSGAQAIVWIKRQTVTRGDLRANPRLCPVRITAGALGNGLPARDLLVSRQHRMMLSSDLAERLCGHREVLVPAIKLTGLKGVRVDSTAGRAGYVHIMFERHQIVFAEGAPSESFLPGPEGLKTLSAGQLGEFRMRFPAHAARQARAEPARPIVDGAEAKRLVAALAESGAPVSGESELAPERLVSGRGHR